MTSRPHWMRCDFSLFRNPKVLKACSDAGSGAGWLYIGGLAYAVEHLTDGWVPPLVPRMLGGSDDEAAALEDVGLWIPVEVTDDGGWLINDFAQYQVTKAEWEELSERNRRNIQKRWAKRPTHLRSVPGDEPA